MESVDTKGLRDDTYRNRILLVRGSMLKAVEKLAALQALEPESGQDQEACIRAVEESVDHICWRINRMKEYVK